MKNTWSIDINHYIETLLRKPGALAGSTALKQMPQKMQELYRVHFKGNGKDFIMLLKYASEHDYSYDDIIQAAGNVKRRGAKRLSLDLLRVALEGSRATSEISDTARQSDEFLEIEIGSEDILSQLSSMMGPGGNENNNTE